MVAIAALVVACLLIVVGVVLISFPAALVAAGVLLAVLVLFVDDSVFKKGGS